MAADTSEVLPDHALSLSHDAEETEVIDRHRTSEHYTRSLLQTKGQRKALTSFQRRRLQERKDPDPLGESRSR